MIRCAIIDLDNNSVVNVIEYEKCPDGVPPGFEGNTIAVADDHASPGWHWDGKKTFDLNPPVAEPPRVKPSRDEAIDAMLASYGLTIADFKVRLNKV